MNTSLQAIAKMIDHSLLHPAYTDYELIEGCNLAARLQVASVCIKPYAVSQAVDILSDSDVKVGTVVGFPHGNNRTEVKLIETDSALSDGAEELDMVVNIGKVLSDDWEYVSQEIQIINNLVTGKGALLKVIFENDFLGNDLYKKKLCEICNEISVAFVKTSTGYGFTKRENGMYAYNGAVDNDLKLMRSECVPSIQIKAAGGIRTLDDVLRVRALGVTRIGATATEAILTEARNRGYQ